MISHGVKQWALNDPYWNNVVLFMDMEGVNSGTTFIDLANTPHTFAISGTGVTTQTNNKKWGTSSAYTNNTGKLIATALVGDTLVGGFTIEFWAYPINYSYGGSNIPGWMSWGLHSTVNGIGLYMTTGGYFIMAINNVQYTASNVVVPLNTWSHFAVTRVGSSIRGFLNGVRKDLVTNSTTITPSGANIRVLGYMGTGVESVPEGYIDAVRVTNGVARYKESFDHMALPEFPGP